jgi:3D (Asp-Asp-Asp) domain-containing protein
MVGSADEPASKESLGSFTITAYGPPWNEMNGTGVTSQGTNLQGKNGVGKYIVAVDPAVIPYGTKLKIDPNPFGDPNIVFLADDTGGAFQGGVKKIDVFDWRGRDSQMRWGSRQARVWKVTGAQSGSGIVGAADDVLGAAGDTANFVGDFVSTVLNFRKLGELLAKVSAWFMRLFFKAVWDYVIAPVLHWNQRAVTYYWQAYFGKQVGGGFYQEYAGLITILFWSLGYGILWTSIEPKTKLAASPRESLLGRTVRSVEGQIARRRLWSPSKAKKKTPPKPTPANSKVEIDRTREFEAKRKRPIAIQGKGSNGENTEQEQNGETPESVSSDGQGQSGLILPPGVES